MAEKLDEAGSVSDMIGKLSDAQSASSEARKTTIVEARSTKDAAGEKVVAKKIDAGAERQKALMKGYTGNSCGECGNFTMVRNGTCEKCDTCGSTSGCS